MNLRNVDLNLLVIFDALMTEKSISRAADRIGVSPSAVSHALRRLRDTFRDELIQRTAQGMVPTQRALDLHRRVRSALAEISRAVDQQLHFDPGTSERTFTIRINDYITACVVPRICARMRSEAPNSKLIVEFMRSATEAHEEPGDIRLTIGADPCGPDDYQHAVWQSGLVVALRQDHPAAATRISLDTFLSLRHLRVAGATVETRVVDVALARRGMSRAIAVTVPSLSAVLPILEHTDLCTVQPAQWIKLYSEPGRIAVAPLPLPEIVFTMNMVWHKGDDPDAGHRWLRDLIEQEFTVLNSIANEGEKLPGDDPAFLKRVPVASGQL